MSQEEAKKDHGTNPAKDDIKKTIPDTSSAKENAPGEKEAVPEVNAPSVKEAVPEESSAEDDWDEDYEYDGEDYEPDEPYASPNSAMRAEAAAEDFENPEDTEDEDADLSASRAAARAARERSSHSRKSRARHILALRILAAAVVVLIVVLGGTYGAGYVYFSSHFGFHTTLNGTDVSLMSADEVEEALLSAADDYVLTITGRGGVTDTISGTDIDLEPVLEGAVSSLIEEQDASAWPLTLFEETEIISDSTASYDEEALTEAIGELAFFDASNITEPVDASYVRGSDGYEIIAETEGTQPDTEGITSAVVAAVSGFVTELELDDSCYTAPSVRSDDAALNAAVTALNNLLDTEITLVLDGDACETLGGEELLSFLSSEDVTAVTVTSASESAEASSESESADAEEASETASSESSDGDASAEESSTEQTLSETEITRYTLSYDTSLIEAYVETLADEYDTYGNSHVFETTSGQTVTVPGGNYGWLMDVDATASALLELLSSGESGDLEMDVVWSQTAEVFGEDDIGDTYAEVDLDEQKVYLYVDGVLVLSTDCVSGKASDSSRYTPDGVFRINYRTSPATLTGADYESYVTYWMPFNGGIGFHDASWRSSFGGTIYISSGSHGCINLPTSAAKTLYSYVYSGMPVIVFGGMTPSEAVAYLAEQEAEEEAAAQSEEEAAIIAQAIANYMALGMTEEEATAQVEADLAAQLAEQQAAAASES